LLRLGGNNTINIKQQNTFNRNSTIGNVNRNRIGMVNRLSQQPGRVWLRGGAVGIPAEVNNHRNIGGVRPPYGLPRYCSRIMLAVAKKK